MNTGEFNIDLHAINMKYELLTKSVKKRGGHSNELIAIRINLNIIHKIDIYYFSSNLI